MKKRVLLLSILLPITVLFSCKDNYTICGLTRRVTLNAGFYALMSGQAVAKAAPSFSLQLINGPVLISNNQNLSQFSTELSSSTDTARYILQLSNNSVPDTVAFIYQSQSVTTSPGCDNIDAHTLQKIITTFNTIDSISTVDAVVDTRGIENIRVFF